MTTSENVSLPTMAPVQTGSRRNFLKQAAMAAALSPVINAFAADSTATPPPQTENP